MRARRALLYMPGDDMHKIQKAAGLDVDCICMDLEDGVAINRKREARETIETALHSLKFGRSERLVRINPIGSGLESDDLPQMIASKPDGIVVPKVSEAGQIIWVNEQISILEQHYDLPGGSVLIFAIIETAKGIANLGEIASCCRRLEALIFGAEDLAAELGTTASNTKWELIYPRSKVITYAAAYGLQAIDMVFIDLKDPDGLITQASQSVQLGYSGMQVIHPDQVEPVQDAFTPDDEAIEAAKVIIESYASHAAAGRGAFTINGKLVDAPIVKSAQATLDKAKAAGKI
jgi:citrate lyase subunit beta-like protein